MPVIQSQAPHGHQGHYLNNQMTTEVERFDPGRGLGQGGVAGIVHLHLGEPDPHDHGRAGQVRKEGPGHCCEKNVNPAEDLCVPVEAHGQQAHGQKKQTQIGQASGNAR